MEQRINLLNKKLKKLAGIESSTEGLAVVSCYFNPCHYSSRLRNYKIFRKQIIKKDIRFITLELAFGDDDFELTGYSEVIPIRTSSDNIMWQKERLLNIGITKLIEEGYEKIAWLDADIVFEDENWPEKISNCLNKHKVCQIFSEVYREDESIGNGEYKTGCIKNYKNTGELSVEDSEPGFGWAAESFVLKNNLLYDRAVASTENDSLIFYANFLENKKLKKKILESDLLTRRLSPKLREDYLIWSRLWSFKVNSEVGFVNMRIKALYHGKIKNRNYYQNHKNYIENDFNPSKDIILGKSKCFEWNSAKTKLHNKIREYFFSRREDN